MQGLRLVPIFWVGVVLCVFRLSGAPLQKPNPRHDDFLKGPTSLLITKAERQSFQSLASDEERDRFVERFWELRNPSRDGEHNAFKEEFYRRVAYVNSFYGRDAGSDGWRTDRGRTYILFGKPQTQLNFLSNQELYPTELWFYSNPGLSELPPFFYVLFVDKDGIGGYRFYHPYVDGPDKLLRAGGTKESAYQYLRRLNAELAASTLSLIPGEPVDTTTYSGSIDSGRIIRAAQAYSEMPSYQQVIAARAIQIERISTRIDFLLPQTQLATFVAYEQGQPWLHWQAEVRDAEAPKSKDGKASFQITASLISAGRLVYERKADPSFPVPAGAEAQMLRQPFLFEDRFPVTEGVFTLNVKIVNHSAAKTYEVTRDVTISRPSDRAHVGDLLVVSGFEPDQRQRPFQFGGVKFFPSSGGSVLGPRGLRVCFQVVMPDPAPTALQVDYTIGGVTSKLRKSFEDKLDLRAADAHGALMTGKTLPIDELPPGAYQLAVRVTDPATGKISARSVSFRILKAEEDVKPIAISQARPSTTQWAAATQYERALCWLSQGHSTEAVAALKSSWELSGNAQVKQLLDTLLALAGPTPSRSPSPTGSSNPRN